MIFKKIISDWTYLYNSDDSAHTKFEIIDPKKISKPKTLFKYYKLNDNALDGLYHNYLYATDPSRFNDLYDCYHEILSAEKEFMFRYMDNYIGYEKAKSNHSKDPVNFEEAFKLFLKADIFRSYGIVSFTDSIDNVLLWSYYSDNRGFAIEYDYSFFQFKFHGPFFMNYKSSFENSFTIKANEDKELMTLYLSNIKNVEWRHENEWRIIIEAPEKQKMFTQTIDQLKVLGGHNRKFNYPKEAIKSVSLGNHFFEPKELRIEEDRNLTIQLVENENIEKKSKILDYLASNDILTKIICRDTVNNQFKLRFNEGRIFKEIGKENRYRFI